VEYSAVLTVAVIVATCTIARVFPAGAGCSAVYLIAVSKRSGVASAGLSAAPIAVINASRARFCAPNRVDQGRVVGRHPLLHARDRVPVDLETARLLGIQPHGDIHPDHKPSLLCQIEPADGVDLIPADIGDDADPAAVPITKAQLIVDRVGRPDHQAGCVNFAHVVLSVHLIIRRRTLTLLPEYRNRARRNAQ
jgi:hypothetical protein